MHNSTYLLKSNIIYTTNELKTKFVKKSYEIDFLTLLEY